ncbi:MAG TPA: hypothetical protein PLC65_19150 [Bacteroidia bacterium]|nr:hypothetical protein [Bacteroidia bacterium]
MKRIGLIIVLVSLGLALQAQNKDSVKFYRNEIGVNTLPLVNVLSGATPLQSARVSLNYRRYLSEKNAIRVSLALFPYQNNYVYNRNGYLSFHSVADTNLIYQSSNYRQTPKAQINLGYERIFASRRLIQSIGGDFFVNYQHKRTEDRFYWTGKSSPLETNLPIFDFNANKLDTMGNVRVTDGIGFGIQAFYNVRIPISKHWLVSATFGPSMSVAFNRDRITENKTGKLNEFRYTTFDFDGTLFSDLSISYRF